MSDAMVESVPRAVTAAPSVVALLVNDEQAAGMLGIGVSYFREMLKSGAIGPQPVRLGRRQLHRPDLLQAWVMAGLPDRAAWLAMGEGGNQP
jgi:hypothetical protein